MTTVSDEGSVLPICLRATIVLLTALCIAVLGIPAVARAQSSDAVVLRVVEISTGSSEINGTPGAQVAMRVTIEGTSNMAGIQFDIEYDRTVVLVQPENIEQGTVPSGFFMQVNPNGKQGMITFAIAGATALGVDSLEVATITFDLVGDDGTATALAFTGELAGDASAPPNRLTVTKHDGRISIGNAPPAPEPDSQTAPTSAASTPVRSVPTPSLPGPTATPEASSGGLCSAAAPGTPLAAGMANGLLLVLPVAVLAIRRRRRVTPDLEGISETSKPEPRDPNP